MDMINIKIKIVRTSKELSIEDGEILGRFSKPKDDYYVLTVSVHDVFRNIAHELGHVFHDAAYGDPGDNTLPFAFENAWLHWWQEHHGNDDSIQFTEE